MSQRGQNPNSSKGYGKGWTPFPKGQQNWNPVGKGNPSQTSQGSKGGKGSMKGRCWHCLEPGHRADQCPKLQSKLNIVASPPTGASSDQPPSATMAVSAEPTTISRIWNVACPTTRVCTVVNKPPVATSNSFSALDMTEEDYPEVPSIPVGFGRTPRFERMPKGTPQKAKKESLKILRRNCVDSCCAPKAICGVTSSPVETVGKQNVGNSEVGMSLNFHVTDVFKPLLSVKRITECGNQVNFGPTSEHCFIQNVGTGDKIPLRETPSGSYVMDVCLKSSDMSSLSEITIDSGAEDNVCPLHWASEFPFLENVPQKSFKGADGSDIHHYGSKNVVVYSPF